MNQQFFSIHKVFVFLLILCLFPACRKGRSKPSGKKKFSWKRKNRPKPVYVKRTKRGDIYDIVLGSATIKAEASVNVVTQVSGKVWKVHGLEGRSFRKGAVLARISNPYLHIAHKKALIQVKKLEADLAKNSPLVKKGYVSKETLQQLSFQLASAKNDLQKTTQDLSNLAIRSTIRGIVTNRHIKKGAWITSNQPAFTIQDPTSLMVELSVPEKYLSKLKVNLQVRLTAEALGKDAEFTGKVIRVAPTIDDKTGTIKVTIAKFSNLKQLKSGMFVVVKLIMEKHEQVILLPKQAISYNKSVPYVFAIDEETCNDKKVCKVKKIILKKGLEDTKFIEVVEGLKGKERVITLGQEGLQDKGAVRIIKGK